MLVEPAMEDAVAGSLHFFGQAPEAVGGAYCGARNSAGP